MKKKSKKYIFAYDRKLGKRVVHVLEGKEAVSMVTGERFVYKPRKRRR